MINILCQLKHVYNMISEHDNVAYRWGNDLTFRTLISHVCFSLVNLLVGGLKNLVNLLVEALSVHAAQLALWETVCVARWTCVVACRLAAYAGHTADS